MKNTESKLALFLMLGQTVEKSISKNSDIVPPESLFISSQYDLALVLPKFVGRASKASEVYKLFFVFENFLRDFILDVLSEKHPSDWWSKVPPDVQTDVEEMEKTEEVKSWMSIGTRDKLSLTTLPQLLRIIEHCWKEGFVDIIRDKSLIQEARHIGHLRNAICHMTEISLEETDRVKQVLRDWFRVVSP